MESYKIQKHINEVLGKHKETDLIVAQVTCNSDNWNDILKLNESW